MTIACLTMLAIISTSINGTTQPLSQSPQKQRQSLSRDNRSVVRQSAISLLDSAIDDLKEVDDLRLRVSMAETIVRHLANSRRERCHSMLDSLFESALKLHKTDSSESVNGSNANSILQKITQVAAQLDPKLAQSYADRYVREEELRNSESSTSTELNTQVTAWYLNVARDLIDKDRMLALSMVRKTLSTAVLPDTLVFLGTLRNRDLVQANRVFVEALNKIKMRRGYDINELLLLYSYVFSPIRVPIVSTQGLGIISIPEYVTTAQSYAVDPVLARQYLTITTDVLLDPQRYQSGNKERLSAGVMGDFCTISLIEPIAVSYLPAVSESLSNQRQVLAGYFQPDRNRELSSSIERWNSMPGGTNQSSRDAITIDYLLKRADQISDSKKKDQLYYRAAMLAAGTKDSEAAFEIVEKISSQYREEAKQFIAFDVAMKAARSDQLDQAEQLARRDNDLTRRCFIFTLIASSLLDEKSPNTVRAMEFLNEVEVLTTKLITDQERIAVLVGAAAVASRLEAARSADFLRSAIRVANKIEDFTGDTRIPRGLNIGGFLFAYTMYSDEFTLAQAIDRLGAIDFNQTVGDIRGFKSRVSRLQATLALCNGVLSKTSP